MNWRDIVDKFGAHAVLPVAPHGAVPDASSKIKIFGKVPSLLTKNGAGYGIKNWESIDASASLAGWFADTRLGVCVRAKSWAALDLDIDDQTEAERVLNGLNIGTAPVRYRANSPRVLIPLQALNGVRKCIFSNGKSRLELLAEGNQWVALGTHKDGAPYAWRNFDMPVLTRTKQQIVSALEALGYDLVNEAKTTKKPVDRVLSKLREKGMVKSETPERAYVVCPWTDSHTTESTGTDSVYLKPHTGGHAEAGYKCLHSHCASKGVHALSQWLGIDLEDLETALQLPLPHTGKIKTLTQAEELLKPYGFKFDSFTQSAACVKGRVNDDVLLDVRSTLSKRGAELTTEQCRDAANSLARMQTYDSLQDYCHALAHDGAPRVDSFLSNYFNLEDSTYHTAVSRYVWSALACRAMRPHNAKADMIIVLSGPEGIGKSSAIAALAPSAEMFAEVDLSANDADIARSLRGVCVVELSELRGYGKRGDGEFKAWVTRQFDAWVPKYKEYEIRAPRRCVLFATTNEDAWLSRDTRNRRYLPIFLNRHVRLAQLQKDAPQLWAEAVNRFSRVEWYEADTYATTARKAALLSDAWENVDVDNVVTASDFLTVVGVEISRQTPRDLARAADVLKRKGYTQTRQRGARVWVKNNTCEVGAV